MHASEARERDVLEDFHGHVVAEPGLSARDIRNAAEAPLRGWRRQVAGVLRDEHLLGRK